MSVDKDAEDGGRDGEIDKTDKAYPMAGDEVGGDVGPSCRIVRGIRTTPAMGGICRRRRGEQERLALPLASLSVGVLTRTHLFATIQRQRYLSTGEEQHV